MRGHLGGTGRNLLWGELLFQLCLGLEGLRVLDVQYLQGTLKILRID